MAMEGDGCLLCTRAMKKIDRIAGETMTNYITVIMHTVHTQSLIPSSLAGTGR